MRDVKALLTTILFATAIGIFLKAIDPHTVLQAIISLIALFMVISWPFPKLLAIALYKDIKNIISTNKE